MITDTDIWGFPNDTANFPLGYPAVHSHSWQALPSHTKLPTAKELTPKITKHKMKASDIADGDPNIGNPGSRRNH